MIKFADILYGAVVLPEEMVPFIKMPEFVRLRGVGLSNVDSYEFKDFGGARRWEHGVAVAALAFQCAKAKGLDLSTTWELALAGLLHDVATPPFGHTGEYVLVDFDHELESTNLLGARLSIDTTPGLPVFEGQLPRFQEECARLGRRLRTTIDGDEVARMVVGEGELGYLISGTLDLDNADNVTRACLHLGIAVDRKLPMRLAEWLGRVDHVPLDLGVAQDPDVQLWMTYRQRLYSAFYDSSEEELGRQALLQHLMRRGLSEGISRRQLIWNTDEGLLSLLELAGTYTASDGSTLRDLVQQYRLLNNPTQMMAVAIEDNETFRTLRLPQAAAWLETELSSPSMQVFVMVAARRWAASGGDLIAPPPGTLLVFKLGSAPVWDQLPEWLKMDVARTQGKALSRAIAEAVRRRMKAWAEVRPWLLSAGRRRADAIRSLDEVGDWTFRLSRNDNFHAYPSTFVHAIPACLINALSLRGELVVDPFGGTGQTAAEVVRYGGHAVSGDTNAVASLVASARFRYLSAAQRTWLRELSADELLAAPGLPPPDFPLRDRWHHERTVAELACIRSYIDAVDDDSVALFMRATLSAILPSTTGRRGRQHGWFADSTPLGKGTLEPPRVDAVALFRQRLCVNLDRTERYYASLERLGRDVERELGRARVVKLDATSATLTDYDVGKHEVAAIITSPPYLCMADYSLGSRLSYYWLFDSELLADDFRLELGARRSRSRPHEAIDSYYKGMSGFARNAAEWLQPGGYVAMVLAEPSARAFLGKPVLDTVDNALASQGMPLIWSHWRTIQWHRNHGYQKLRRERIAVYQAI